MSKKVKSNLGNVYKEKRWAERWARGRPIKKVPGGWKIMAKRKRRKVRRSSRRKTFRKKSTARKARKKGQVLYKVKGGWRLRRTKR